MKTPTQVSPATRTCTVRVGTSGYSFPSWTGPFYPSGTRPESMLRYYASQFDSVEVNYSFYRLPTAQTLSGMVRNTPDDFLFFIKAHHSFTHHQDLSLSDAFMEGVRPMSEAGKLAGLLFQFPQSFKNNLDNRAHLHSLSKKFTACPLAVEFRDVSWAVPPLYAYLADLGLSLVSVDEPSISTLFPRIAASTNDLGYLRFHSRDKSKWYGYTGDRYDYLYQGDELEEWIPMLQTIAQRSRNIFVFFNNCHQAQAAENAQAMKDLISRSGLSVGSQAQPAPFALTG